MRGIQVIGERCSGTNYLEQIIKLNSPEIITNQFIYWKHHLYEEVEELPRDVLYLFIIRNPYDWLASLYVQRHHIHHMVEGKSFISFLDISGKHSPYFNDCFISFRSLFECRYRLLERALKMKKLGYSILFICLEDLRIGYPKILSDIYKLYGCPARNYDEYQNWKFYKNSTEILYQEKKYELTEEEKEAVRNRLKPFYGRRFRYL